MGQERRRHPRFAANHLTTVLLPAPEGGGREEIVGRTLDLSQGGVLLEVASGIPEGTVVTVSIAVEEHLLEVVGTVLRAIPVGEGFHEVGITFGPMVGGTSELIEVIREKLSGPPE